MNINKQFRKCISFFLCKYFLIGILLIFLSCQNETAKLIENKTAIENKTPYKGVHINSDIIVNGYTDKFSYSSNEMASIYINSKDSVKNAVVKLFSVNGIIADSIMTNLFPQNIKNPIPWENGYGYEKTISYSPQNLKSGIYFWENKISMIVKSAVPKEITVLYPSNTDNAYCLSGGLSMYSLPVYARKVSFLRPILNQRFSMSFLDWINKTEFNNSINYISDIDLDDELTLSNTKLLIIIGHSEYWTLKARKLVDQFVNNGHNMLILSGNTMWWQVRYNSTNDQLICYKNEKEDPITDNLLKTTNWNESCVNYPIFNSIGCDFTLGGYGLNDDTGWDGFKICSNNSPLFLGTNLKKGDIIRLPSFEYDGTHIKGFDKDGCPILDNSKLKFYKSEIIGFDIGFRTNPTCGTFFAFQKTSTSGKVINTATTDWCAPNGIGGKDGDNIKIITRNMINILLNDGDIFSK